MTRLRVLKSLSKELMQEYVQIVDRIPAIRIIVKILRRIRNHTKCKKNDVLFAIAKQ